MKVKRIRRVVGRLGLALAVTAVFVPAAQARPLDMPPGSLDSVQTRQYADDVRVEPAVITPLVRNYADDLHAATPQVRSEPSGFAPIDVGARPDLVSPQVTPISSGDDTTGFDWRVAGFGLTAFGLALLLGSALYIGRHNRKDPLAAA